MQIIKIRKTYLLEIELLGTITKSDIDSLAF